MIYDVVFSFFIAMFPNSIMLDYSRLFEFLSVVISIMIVLYLVVFPLLALYRKALGLGGKK